MRSEAVNLLRFFQIPKKCIIPIYQRTYSWTEEQCELLWNDIIRVGTSEKIPNHFVGSFVYVQDNPSQVLSATPLCMVIDGQQRMTTISLILLAISDNLKETKKSIELSDDFSISSDFISLTLLSKLKFYIHLLFSLLKINHLLMIYTSNLIIIQLISIMLLNYLSLFI
jgi:uncharacterized protein with ParB-like and HNH nuclease domain